MELRWQPNLDVSALHAAWVIATGRQLMSVPLHSELQPLAQELDKFGQSWQIPASVFWRQLIGLAVDLPSNNELAERVMRRLCGDSLSAGAVGRLSATIAQCEAVMRRQFPNLMEQLALRVAPLQQAWEARGPGLLNMLAAATGADFLVESASIVLVQPVYGGDGLAHLNTNRVHIEAVLTDVDPRLPEVLRLCWLLGQLNLDRPIYSDRVHGHSLGEIAESALIPAVLAAAQEVQLSSLSTESIQLALELWTREPVATSAQRAEILAVWWETATDGSWDWNTRLAALAQM